MGFDARAPETTSRREMKAAAGECLESGAFGLSSGLIYAPGMFSTTDELAALATELAPYDAIYSSHVRGLERDADAGLRGGGRGREAAGVRVQHSHLEGFGKRFWPDVERMLALHEQARRETASTTVSTSSPTRRRTRPSSRFFRRGRSTEACRSCSSGWETRRLGSG